MIYNYFEIGVLVVKNLDNKNKSTIMCIFYQFVQKERYKIYDEQILKEVMF